MQREEVIWYGKIFFNNLISRMKADSWAHIRTLGIDTAVFTASVWEERQAPICHEAELN